MKGLTALCAGSALYLASSSGLAHSPDPPSLQHFVDHALQAFDGQDYERAQAEFERALPLATSSSERVSLLFNLAVCLMELGRPGEAEQRYLRAAELSESEVGLARLHAGLSALAAGAPDRAEAYLRTVEATTEEERALRARLKVGLSQFRERRQLALARKALAEGYEALLAADFERARERFDAALRFQVPDSDRADAHYGLAVVLHRRREQRGAGDQVDLSLRLDPSRYESHWLKGVLLAARGERERAAGAFRRALVRQPSAGDRLRIEAALERLDPRPPSGVSAVVQLASGYDTNTSQSGAAERLGLSSGIDSGDSAVVEALGSAELRVRAASRWLMTGGLTLSTSSPTESRAQALSLTSGQATLGLDYFPARHLEFGVALRGGHWRTDWLPAEAFVSEFRMGVGGTLRSSSRWQSRLKLGWNKVEGHGQSTALSGSRVTASLSETYLEEGLSGRFQLGVLHSGAGRETRDANTDLIPRCENGRQLAIAVCDTLRFSVPLSFNAADLSAVLTVNPFDTIQLESGLFYQLRAYTAEAQLLAGREPQVVEGSETLRRDHVFDLGLGVIYTPSSLPNWSIWVRYQLRINRSNLNPDLDDPQHRFDYDNRNFVQHRSLAGVTVGVF